MPEQGTNLYAILFSRLQLDLGSSRELGGRRKFHRLRL